MNCQEWHSNRYFIMFSTASLTGYDFMFCCLPWILPCIAISLYVCSTILKDILRPVHHQRPPTGKQWNLPPGPSPSPIVGNLFQILKARRNNKLQAYVRGTSIIVLSASWLVTSFLLSQGTGRWWLCKWDRRLGFFSTASVLSQK